VAFVVAIARGAIEALRRFDKCGEERRCHGIDMMHDSILCMIVIATMVDLIGCGKCTSIEIAEFW